MPSSKTKSLASLLFSPTDARRKILIKLVISELVTFGYWILNFLTNSSLFLTYDHFKKYIFFQNLCSHNEWKFNAFSNELNSDISLDFIAYLFSIFFLKKSNVWNRKIYRKFSWDRQFISFKLCNFRFFAVPDTFRERDTPGFSSCQVSPCKSIFLVQEAIDTDFVLIK